MFMTPISSPQSTASYIVSIILTFGIGGGMDPRSTMVEALAMLLVAAVAHVALLRLTSSMIVRQYPGATLRAISSHGG